MEKSGSFRQSESYLMVVSLVHKNESLLHFVSGILTLKASKCVHCAGVGFIWFGHGVLHVQ